VNKFIDHLQAVTTNTYNTVAISTLYNSLDHTVYCSQSVTRLFPVSAPTMAIPLPPVSSLIFTDSRTELTRSSRRQSQSQSHIATERSVSQSVSLGVEIFVTV
jgi:hypothetical protein